MRFNNTRNNRLYAGGGGRKYVTACNVTGSAVAVRVFNATDLPSVVAMETSASDQDNAKAYDYSLPANDSRVFVLNGANPIVVYNATANAVNWTCEDAY